MTNLNVSELPTDQLRSIDSICGIFESAWKAGSRPVIEDHLGSAVEAVQPVLLSKLIRAELEWRFRLGDAPTPQEYRQRFPACTDAITDWLAQARSFALPPGTALSAATVSFPQPSLETDGGEPAVLGSSGPPLKTLGEYEVLEPIKLGGMGEVYKARHRRLDKLVAIKLLLRHYRTSANMVARFRREMEAVGRLDHPNLVEAYDAGEEQGIVYLVMKLIAGDDLSELVKKRGPLRGEEACDLMRQAALGLHELHQCGLVHRDVKPSNIKRTPDGVVKVFDLGLARWFEKRDDGADATEPGVVLGTLDFLAPEQSSSPATVDFRADLYGLGGTLFFLLTGRAPFADRHGVHAKLRAHESEEPPDVRSLRPEVPATLADLVKRLLAKRPEDRPQTAAEVAATLDYLAKSLSLGGETDSLAVPAAQGGAATENLPSHQATGASTVCMMSPSSSEVPGQLPLARVGRRKSRRAWLAGGACGLAAMLALAIYLGGRSRPEPTTTPRENDVVVADKLRVLSLDVQHFATIKERFVQLRGMLGKDTFAARRDDSVTVEARLSRPGYAYLIAFRPDGTEELCFPEQEEEVPLLTDCPRYPSKSRGVNYGLNEGEGLQVFAVVVSHRPLPAYQAWRAQRGTSPWKHAETPAEVVWRDDGVNVEPLTIANTEGQRGKGWEVSGKEPIAKLTDWLRQTGADEVAAVGFAVLPKIKS